MTKCGKTNSLQAYSFYRKLNEPAWINKRVQKNT